MHVKTFARFLGKLIGQWVAPNMSDDQLDAKIGKIVREYGEAQKRLEELTADFQHFVTLGHSIPSDPEKALRTLVNLRQDLTVRELCDMATEYRDIKAELIGLKSLLPKGLGGVQ